MSSSVLLNKFTKLFPLPKSLSFDFVGINICKYSIKVMKLSDSKFGKTPVKFKEYPLDGKCELMDLNPKYENCEEVKEVLREVKKDFNVQYVNVSIPEVRTYVYKTKLPSSVGENIAEAILFSLDENVPLRPEDVLVDYFVVSVMDDEIEVVVTAVSREIIELYTILFEESGLDPISFEPETHAIARGIINNEDTSQYVLLNIDPCLSNIAIIEKGIVQYTQTVSPTSRDFEEGFDEEKTKTLKEEINKIIIYWETTLSNSFGKRDSLKTLYIVGDLPQTNDLINYLEKNLSLNVKKANVWTNCFSLDDYIPKIKALESLRYATAIGLALKRIK